jgi:hypothetical protein
MLAFNLGVFFRNLKGSQVDFAARAATCEVSFTGMVEALSDQVDLTRHLSVTLARGDLRCHIAFDEGEDPEGEEQQEDAVVDVKVVALSAEGDQVLIETRFRFEEISLKPHAPNSPEPPQDPAQAA